MSPYTISAAKIASNERTPLITLAQWLPQRPMQVSSTMEAAPLATISTRNALSRKVSSVRPGESLAARCTGCAGSSGGGAAGGNGGGADSMFTGRGLVRAEPM